MTPMSESPVHLAFDGGTIVLTGATPEGLAALPHVQFDSRAGVHRAEGRFYRPLVEHLRARGIPYADAARASQPTPWPLRPAARSSRVRRR